MADQLHAYVVVLSFQPPGPLHSNIILAPDEASAAAMATLMLMQNTPTTAPLLAVIAQEIRPETIRHMARAVEGKLPPSGEAQVLSLVPKGLEPDDPRRGSMAVDPALTPSHRGAELLRAGQQQVYTDPTWPHGPTDPAA